jgi:DNA-binding response OmpR family regulator
MGGGEPQTRAADEPPVGRGAVHAVLVVDSEPAILAWAAEALESAGIQAAVASDGRTALRDVADGRVRPTVLVTSIELPGMSGIELAARLCALRPGLRIVMITADPARAAMARDRTSIVATVLLKPIDAGDLVAAVGPDARSPVG